MQLVLLGAAPVQPQSGTGSTGSFPSCNWFYWELTQLQLVLLGAAPVQPQSGPGSTGSGPFLCVGRSYDAVFELAAPRGTHSGRRCDPLSPGPPGSDGHEAVVFTC